MAGKGDKPRNCFSKDYKNNYDNISWKKEKTEKPKEVKAIKSKTRYVY